jgi:hypothetical protein
MLPRYINQLPAEMTYIDHLGRTRIIDPRNDIQWHRVMAHIMGWIYLPNLNYVMTMWTVNSTEQVRIVGNLTYNFHPAFKFSVGVNGIPGTRSLNGSHPLWLAGDRVMADEYFRPGFTQGVWATGEPIKRVFYNAMLGNNIAQLGVSAAELTRDMAFGMSVWTMPTTGEFGPRGGYGDYEWHKKVATRIGTSYTRSREDRASQVSQASPDNTQIRLSDALFLFETGALAEGVTVQKADYTLSAVDVGLKWHGIFLQTELYYRWLGKFLADGPLPLISIYDQGYYIMAAFFPIPKRLELYGATSQIYGAFNRSWEGLGGLNWFPADTRYFRVNLNLLVPQASAASSTFGYYVGGQRGFTVSIATSVFF